MNKSKAIKIAIAFKRGMAFIRGMRQLAQDADVPEGTRWITIGAHKNEDGESSGGRHVLIDKESGTILKGLSKDVQGKTLKDAFKELKKTPGEKAAKGEGKKKAALNDPYDISFSDFLNKVASGNTADLDKYGDFDLLQQYFKRAKSDTDKKQLADRLNKAYSNIPDDYKYLTQKALTFVSYKDYNPEHGAYYGFSTNQVSIDLDELAESTVPGATQYPARDPFMTFIHEVAHATDMHTGFNAEDRYKRSIGANPEFKEAVEKDIGALVAKLREEARQKLETGPTSDDFKKMPPDGQEFMVNMKAGHILEDTGNAKSTIYLGISDMVSGYTNDAISGGGHHEKSYWESDPLNKYLEIFAHVYEAHMYPEYLKEFRSLFPNLVQTTDKLMREAAQRVRDDYTEKMERIRQREERRKARIDRAG